jgi:conserved oligomeric Golgi complex subunit 2
MSDVLTSVKKMEESLKRLKAARGTSSAVGTQGMSDDDKIRTQLYLDVKEFGAQVTDYGSFTCYNLFIRYNVTDCG